MVEIQSKPVTATQLSPTEDSKDNSPDDPTQSEAEFESIVLESDQSVKKMPPSTRFSEDIISLHPESAIARRIIYSKTIRKPRPVTADENRRGCRSLSTTRKIYSADFEQGSVKRYALICSPMLNKKVSESQSAILDSDSSSASPSITSLTSLYWIDSPLSSVSPTHSQGSYSSRSRPVSTHYGPDALYPATRAYFKHTSLTVTWNQERLFKAVYNEINRKYASLVQFIDLCPPRQFMVGLFYTLPWKTITFEMLLHEVEKRWVQPMYYRYRRAFVTTCMLYGGRT